MGVKQNIVELMNKRGIKNPSKLAELAGLKKGTVYAILKRDNVTLSFQTAQKLANALECSESDILGFDGDDKEYFDGLKRRILQLTKELKGLKEDYIEVPMLDIETDEEYTYKEYLSAPKMEMVNMEIEGLQSEIIRLLNSNKIEVAPTKYAEIINFYKELNEIGQEEAVKRVEELTYIGKYTKEK